jgi:hypothetical protein
MARAFLLLRSLGDARSRRAVEDFDRVSNGVIESPGGGDEDNQPRCGDENGRAGLGCGLWLGHDVSSYVKLVGLVGRLRFG